MDDETLMRRAMQLGTLLESRGRMLVTAESCTGGWLAKLCTDIPGSSAWFERGYVTYSNAAKQELLGVSVDTIDRYGAVSAQTVREMARGALAASHADHSVAISGIAGPGGGSVEKPVGLVWLAFAQRDGVHTIEHRFAGDRAAVRRAAVAAALAGLLGLFAHD